MNYKELNKFMSTVHLIRELTDFDEDYICDFLSKKAKSSKNTLLTEALLVKNHVFMTGNLEK